MMKINSIHFLKTEYLTRGLKVTFSFLLNLVLSDTFVKLHYCQKESL